jgi:hypothetical protein
MSWSVFLIKGDSSQLKLIGAIFFMKMKEKDYLTSL